MSNYATQQIQNLNQQVAQLQQQGRYQQAIPLAMQLRDLVRQHIGEDNANYAVCLNNLGQLHCSLGDYQNALNFQEQAIAIYRRTLGEDHPEYAKGLNNLAGLYQARLDYAKAETTFKQAIAIWHRTVGEKHPDFAVGLNNLGLLYQAMGRHKEAEPLFQQAVAIQQGGYPKEDTSQNYAESLNNQAASLYQKGDYAAAEALFREVVKLLKDGLGKEHPRYAQALSNLALTYQKQGNYQASKKLLQEALEIQQNTLGSSHPDIITALNNQALQNSEEGNNESAVMLFQQVLDIQRQTLGERHPQYAACLINLAGVYREQHRYPEAEALYKQASAIQEKTLGKTHPDRLAGLNYLAQMYVSLGRNPDAEAILREIEENNTSTDGEEGSSFEDMLQSQAETQESVGNYAEARRLFTKLVELRRDRLGNTHPDTAKAINKLAKVYQQEANYGEAEQLYFEAMEIIRQNYGEGHFNFTFCLNNLGSLYEAKGDYKTARVCYQKALNVLRKAVGTSDKSFAQVLNNLALLHYKMGDYATAQQELQDALNLYKQIFGETHPDFANMLNNAAAVSAKAGQFAQALQLYEQVLSIQERAVGKQHPHYAIALNNLGGLYAEMGNYTTARTHIQQALIILEPILGANHPTTTTMVGNLAALNMRLGNIAGAEQDMEQVLKARVETLGEDHPELADSLNNLGTIYSSKGITLAFKQHLQQMAATRSSIFEEDNSEYMEMLAQFEDVDVDLVKQYYKSAESCWQRALSIRQKLLGSRHPQVADSLSNLAGLKLSIGQYPSAKVLLLKALEMRKQLLGERHPDVADTLDLLAWVYAAMDRPTRAMQVIEQAAEIYNYLLSQIFTCVSDEERLAYLQKVRANLDAVLALTLQYFANDSWAIRNAFNLILQRKGIGLEFLVTQREAIFQERYPKLRSQFQELMNLKSEIARLTLAGLGTPAFEENQHILEDLDSRKAQLERELARAIPEMELEQYWQTSDYRTIARSLPLGTVLVDIVCTLGLINFKAVPARGEWIGKPSRYIAFVLHSDSLDDIKMIDLGESTPIDVMVTTFLQAITGDRNNFDAQAVKQVIHEFEQAFTGKGPSRRGDNFEIPRESDIDASEEQAIEDQTLPSLRHLRSVLQQKLNSKMGELLRKTVFDPLKPFLETSKRLLLSLDGNLTRLPFEILPLGSSRYVIDEYEISYLSTSRDILQFSQSSPQSLNAPIVIADPDFDYQETPVAHKIEIPISTPKLIRQLPRFNRLQGTKTEGEQIGRLLGVDPWLGNAALKGRLKRFQSPSILHIATHGFFLRNSQRDLLRNFPGQIFLKETNQTSKSSSKQLLGENIDRPMLRSGLALAGINTWLSSDDPSRIKENGVLTAEDVMGLDLSRTQLVVLSACETGLGEVEKGEGVFGLQRAFSVAGSRTLVMSLWKVPDKETKELMTTFYQHLLNGYKIPNALRAAQLSIKERFPDNPFYWGAFICQGCPDALTDNFLGKISQKQ